ncbi:MAG: Fe-S assembly protein IscX [Anaerolineae bacterium CFX3]|nr:Fe-S assembly protein IscX [Anaerolineae bacterium CFX3]MCQ3947871.1 Fe-S assembly protein IscX [Anaerolineae bacterium]RIK25699.1 MAG: Fe-S assembly protein IscX [Anaerolineae bacterium]
MNWESTYAIAVELRRLHPDADLEKVSLQQIHDWTLALPDFEDDPLLVNDDILSAIFQDWFEENIHGQ